MVKPRNGGCGLAAVALMILLAGVVQGRELSAATKVVSSASASASNGGSARSVVKCSAANGKSAVCEAVSVGDGKDAFAFTEGAAIDGDIKLKSVALAVGKGDGKAFAVAVGKAVKDYGDPYAVVPDLTVVFAKSINEGSGKALAAAIFDGVKAGGDVSTAVVGAVAWIINEKGCDYIKPTLAKAVAKSSESSQVFQLGDAFDVTIKVGDVDIVPTECLFPACKGDTLYCCMDHKNSKTCGNWQVFRYTPRLSLKCPGCGDHCLCPP